MTIAVLDWGIGGMPAFTLLRERLPRAALVYRSDQGFPPYGTVPAPVLAARVTAVARELEDTHGGLAALVLACNAASTIADDVRRAIDAPVFEVISHGVALAIEAHAAGRANIAVLGGRRTIEAGIHAARLAEAGIVVTAVASQPLSAHVEAGRLDGPELLADLVPILSAADARGPADALVLACTHYPALAPVIARLRPGVALLDPVPRMVDEVVAHLAP